jgi:hypothetical protein
MPCNLWKKQWQSAQSNCSRRSLAKYHEADLRGNQNMLRQPGTPANVFVKKKVGELPARFMTNWANAESGEY